MSIRILFFAMISIITIQLLNSQPTQWTSKDMGGGGAVYSPSINPLNPNEIYLSCDMGVMFHSTDSARTWNTIHFNTLSGNRFSEVQFTNNNSIRYVLRQNLSNSNYVPNITTNGGTTWTPINPSGIGSYGAYRLFAHPQYSNIIIVSGYDKIFFSNSSGAAYTQIYSTTSFVHVAGIFFDNSAIYICTNKGIFGVDLNGLSILNFTAHATSSGVFSATENMVSFSGAKQGGVIRFIGVSNNKPTFNPRTYGEDVPYFQGLYKMDYLSGTLWTDITSGFQSSAPNNKAYNIAMKPDDIATFYIGGRAKVPDNATGISLGTVFKTTNGGSSFSNIFLNNGFTNNNNIYTGWQGSKSGTSWNGHTWNGINSTEGITVSRNNINYLIKTDKSNVYISTDGGATWIQRYVTQTQHDLNTLINQSDIYKDNGLQTTACYWLTWVTPNDLIASFADLLAIRSSNGGNTWSFNYTGLDTNKVNDASMVIKHTDGKLYASTGDVPGSNGDYSDLRISQAIKGRVSVSSDNGLTWQTFKSFSRPVLSVDFNPLNMQQMYVTVASENGGIGGIYKFTDKNNPSSMITLPSPLGTQNRPGHIKVLNDGSLMCYFTCRDIGTSGPVYIFANSSGVFFSTNDGQNWTGNNLPDMTYDVRSVSIDPFDNTQNTFFACISGNGNGNAGVYKTINRGSNWSLVIPSKKSISCTFNPALANEMYLTTEDEGLYYYTNTNSTPSPIFVNSYPFKKPQQVFFNPYNTNEVWVTSFGNGLKVGYTNNTAINHNQTQIDNNTFMLFPNPSKDVVNIILNNQKIKNVKVYDTSGKLLLEHTDSKFSITNLPFGIYFVVLQTENKTIINKLLKY